MKILFPATNRVHMARQRLLLDKLKEAGHKVMIMDFTSFPFDYGTMSAKALHYANEFSNTIRDYNPDLVLIRGDRFEMLPLAMVGAFEGYKIAHIEGGDLSGVIDNKVRHAITKLADIHFATNKESYSRLISMGTDPDKTFNFGSLDVEFAKSIDIPPTPPNDYIVVCFHSTDTENGKAVETVLKKLEYNKDEFGNRDGIVSIYERSLKVINIISNSDYGKANGDKEYSPEEYIQLIANAKCLVGNSSSFLKEASIFGVPVVNVGDRQDNRLKPRNVLSVPHNQDAIKIAIEYQLKHGIYIPDYIYYQPNTSKKIANALMEQSQLL